MWSLGDFLKTSLKWAFKFAVMGIGFYIGTEIIGEFLQYGVFHSGLPISDELASLSKEFTKPILSSFSDWVGGVDGLSGFKSFLKGIHEFFGKHDSFLPTGMKPITDIASAAVGGGISLPGAGL